MRRDDCPHLHLVVHCCITTPSQLATRHQSLYPFDAFVLDATRCRCNPPQMCAAPPARCCCPSRASPWDAHGTMLPPLLHFALDLRGVGLCCEEESWNGIMGSG